MTLNSSLMKKSGATAGLSSSDFPGKRCTAGQASSGTHFAEKRLFQKADKRRDRRGVALLIALCCLAVVSMISVGLLQLAAHARQQARMRQRELQAAWLAESTVTRAAAQLAVDAEYSGETWTVSASELGGRHAGLAVIEITPRPSRPGSFQVRVTADVASSQAMRARHSKQIIVRLSRPATPEDSEP